MTERTFYMVYIEGKNTPTKKHASRSEAERELIRLLEMPNNAGKKGYILEAVKVYSVMFQPVIDCRELNRS